MSRFNHYNKITTRGYVYRVLAAIGAIATLVFFMPRGSQLHFEFKEGKPWNYPAFIARENFPILKSEELLQHEHDSLMRLYRPIYEMDTETEERLVMNFKKAFEDEMRPATSYSYRNHIVERLRRIYQTGILSTDDYEQLKANQTKGIVISVQNMGSTHSLNELFTPKTAYRLLMHEEDTTRYQRGVLQHCNLSRFLEPNLKYDKERSLSQLENLEKQLVRYSGEVVAGQKIIDHGDIVDEKAYNILYSMQVHQEGRKRSASEQISQLGGQILYAAILVVCLLVFFNQFRSDYLQRPRTVMLLLLLTLVFPLLTYTMVKHHFLSVYLIPYCILPIFLRVFLDSRTAFITHLTSVLLSAMALTSTFEFIIVQCVAGLTAIYALKELSQRSELFRAVVLVTLASLLCHLCFELLRMSLLTSGEYDYGTYIYIIVNGVFLLISYLLLFPFERLFQFTSLVTLVELSNTNNEILRRLSEEAPGTFQHSMQVANLAAEVANAIGAKSQLVRTGALYHDIGKLSAPVFFTENQNGVNPHDNLSYVKSAQIIISHVKKGLELAEKHRLPDVIQQFIATHHGTSKAKYFYIKYKNENPLLQVDESFFTYPGPNPSTVEQAILMMADAVEAASRSLPEYTEESIGGLVGKIVDSQVAEGYFAQCPITFHDIDLAKQVLTQKLMTIYHTRISYPTLETAKQ
ncbi:MAG: HDIG domain-containing protein [Bacteroidaceae bacterium]|nr:HDIG domain-containing protein [Bacteroidaceae bacterium]